MRPLILLLACLGGAAAAAAQTAPSDPVTLAGGRVVLGGDAAVSVAPEDRGFFNYNDYEHSTLRELRIGVRGSVRATDHISVLGEMRSENFTNVTPFALYARIRPFLNRRFDVQIGRIPPTFGAFTRRAYAQDNPLIGYPLAYQYLTSLRADAVPASADELFRMRGRGWLTQYTIGNTAEAPGLPLVTAFRWDTGVQVSTGWRMLGIAAAITNGSTSNPRVSDDNSGKQTALRATVTPATGFLVGWSFARAPFLSRNVLSLLPAADDSDFEQLAQGLDIEYSRDRWLARADAVYSQWRLPLLNDRLSRGRLRAGAVALEGRYTIVPGVYAAARVERLAFNRVEGSRRIQAWEAPVSRLEIGGGYYLQRNIVARLSWQHNVRDAGRVRRNDLVAAQLLFWM